MKASLQSPVVRLSARLLRWRWLVTALLMVFYAGFEVIEHPPTGHGVDVDFLSELLILAGVFPLTFGITLSLLARAESERARAVHQLDQHHDFNQQLLNALDWDELARILVRFPGTIAPVAGASLLLYDESPARFQLAAEWWEPDGNASPHSSSYLAPDFCRACALAKSGSLSGTVPCSYLEDSCMGACFVPEQGNCYCLPLVHSGRLIALLQLHSPPGVRLTEDQTNVLNSVAPSMALAVDGARPQPSDSIQAAAVKAERQRIARQLHDTLGQNLSYLRLKLDQFTGDDVVGEIAAVRRDLERMREIANEAYEQVRGTLRALRLDNSIDLATALLTLAKSVGKRADFWVELTSEGEPCPLPAHVQHQILNLFQEALANVEKHANARRVVISLLWADDDLTVRFADDGQGFAMDTIRSNGHFGLAIMQERAEEINGCLTVTSCPNAGTELALRLPLPAISQNYARGERIDR